MYLDSSMHKYLDDLAAKKPAPGGGSAAALAAAMGVSLIEMVSNYTIGNPKYKDVETRITDILMRAEKARAELKHLVDEDVRAYGNLSKGFKNANIDPDKLQGLYKDAADVPFDICKISSECLSICDELADIGNKNLITDTAIAAILLEGAFFAAKYNVYINLKYIKDNDYIGHIHNALAPLEERLPKLKEDILEKCEGIIQR